MSNAYAVVSCNYAEHGEAIRSILNHAIAHTTARWEESPWSSEAMQAWFNTKTDAGAPVLGVIGPTGDLLGYGTYGQFRPFAGYKHTMEHSIYVRHDARGRGVGKLLLERLIEKAKAAQCKVLIAAIDGANLASMRLHEKMGFQRSGLIPSAGVKFGSWLDLVFYYLLFDECSFNHQEQ